MYFKLKTIDFNFSFCKHVVIVNKKKKKKNQNFFSEKSDFNSETKKGAYIYTYSSSPTSHRAVLSLKLVDGRYRIQNKVAHVDLAVQSFPLISPKFE